MASCAAASDFDGSFCATAGSEAAVLNHCCAAAIDADASRDSSSVVQQSLTQMSKGHFDARVSAVPSRELKSRQNSLVRDLIGEVNCKSTTDTTASAPVPIPIIPISIQPNLYNLLNFNFNLVNGKFRHTPNHQPIHNNNSINTHNNTHTYSKHRLLTLKPNIKRDIPQIIMTTTLSNNQINNYNLDTNIT